MTSIFLCIFHCSHNLICSCLKVLEMTSNSLDQAFVCLLPIVNINVLQPFLSNLTQFWKGSNQGPKLCANSWGNVIFFLIRCQCKVKQPKLFFIVKHLND